MSVHRFMCEEKFLAEQLRTQCTVRI